MFSKPAKPPKHPAPSAAPPPLPDHGGPRKTTQPKAASLIADDVVIEGHVIGGGELQLDGEIRGDVRAARLSVGETGRVEGAVQAETLEVRGRVVGSITAKQVRLFPTAHVDGDITHEQLIMEAGAFFQGRSLKFQRPAAPAPAELMDLSATQTPKTHP
jgi:cytoskeletal protein CcmA (bactofilin family)